jgi:hypothetical protein
MQTVLGSGGAIGIDLAKALTQFTNDFDRRFNSKKNLSLFLNLSRTYSTLQT